MDVSFLECCTSETVWWSSNTVAPAKASQSSEPVLAIADKQPSGPTYHSNYDAEEDNLSEKVVKAQKLWKVTQKVLDMAQRVESQSSRFKRTMGRVRTFIWEVLAIQFLSWPDTQNHLDDIILMISPWPWQSSLQFKTFTPHHGHIFSRLCCEHICLLTTHLWMMRLIISMV